MVLLWTGCVYFVTTIMTTTNIMTKEGLDKIKEYATKDAERFFKENHVEIDKNYPPIYPYFPYVQEYRISEYRTVKLSNSTNPIASF